LIRTTPPIHAAPRTPRPHPTPPTQLSTLSLHDALPILAIDHAQLRKNYATFKRHLPRVQAYYAVKANSDPAIVRTLYGAGASFEDRKSTRLNSSHLVISYAVFCLKKKKSDIRSATGSTM